MYLIPEIIQSLKLEPEDFFDAHTVVHDWWSFNSWKAVCHFPWASSNPAWKQRMMSVLSVEEFCACWLLVLSLSDTQWILSFSTSPDEVKQAWNGKKFCVWNSAPTCTSDPFTLPVVYRNIYVVRGSGGNKLILYVYDGNVRRNF